jgi:hypothetical protein
MDPFFDPKKSSSSTIKKCGLGGQKCYFKQAYSEGSSWHAFKVHDLVTTGTTEMLAKTYKFLSHALSISFSLSRSPP